MTPVPRTLPVLLPDLLEWGDHSIQGKATVPAALLLDLLVRNTTEQTDLDSNTPPLVLRDADILGEMAQMGLARVALSVTTLDRKLARAMEPRAGTPARRLDAIRALSGVSLG